MSYLSQAMLKSNKTDEVRVLGIDPGTGRMGFGIALEKSGKYFCPSFGCFTSSAINTQPERLAILQDQLLKVIEEQKPALAVVEKLFFSKNIRTAMAVAEARGMVMTTLMQKHIPVVEISPQQVKIGITGYGKAGKRQVQIMVQKLFDLPSPPTPDDAADALALAFVGLSYK